jgi:hypothetical protein
VIQFVAGAAGGGLIVGSLLSWYFTGEYKDAKWEAATNKIKIEAANVLQKETDKVLSHVIESNNKVRELEAQHVQEEKSLADIERRNRQLARELGGLRDPGRRPHSTDAVPATSASSGGTEPATSTAYLSAEASELLLSAAAEVDALARYAKVCYDWKEIVKAQYQATLPEQ